MKKLTILFVLIFLINSVHAQSISHRIWIDTDILTGKFKKDVDDALTLIMALRDTTLQIEGISFVQNVDYSEKVTKKLLGWYAPSRNIPTFKGADGKADAGKKTEAVNAIIVALEKGPMSIVALGPLTNIATVLKLRPDLHSNILAITYCAGRKPGMLLNPGSGKVRFSDYNFDLDPVSAQVLLDTEIDVLLAGYDCSDSLFLSRKDFIHLKKSNSKGDRWLYKQMKSWENLWRVFMGSEKGFIPFDCATLGALFYMDEFEVFETVARIEVEKNDTKNTVKTDTKPYLFVNQTGERKYLSYCEHARPEFKKRLLKAIDHPDYR